MAKEQLSDALSARMEYEKANRAFCAKATNKTEETGWHRVCDRIRLSWILSRFSLFSCLFQKSVL